MLNDITNEIESSGRERGYGYGDDAASPTRSTSYRSTRQAGAGVTGGRSSCASRAQSTYHGHQTVLPGRRGALAREEGLWTEGRPRAFPSLSCVEEGGSPEDARRASGVGAPPWTRGGRALGVPGDKAGQTGRGRIEGAEGLHGTRSLPAAFRTS